MILAAITFFIGAALPLLVLSVRKEVARARRHHCAWCPRQLERGRTGGVCNVCLATLEREGHAAPDGWPKA